MQPRSDQGLAANRYSAMTAGMVFELWMVQHWFAVAQAWQAVYWRDTESLQQQFRQQCRELSAKALYCPAGTLSRYLRPPCNQSQLGRFDELPVFDLQLCDELAQNRRDILSVYGFGNGEGPFLQFLSAYPKSPAQSLISAGLDSNYQNEPTPTPKSFSRSHDAVIRVFDEAGNAIEAHDR